MDTKFFIKIFITLIIIVLCAQIGKKAPLLAGLIATAPITTLIVLIWLWTDKPGDYNLVVNYTKAVCWGMIPTIFFFLTAYLCFKGRIQILPTVLFSFAIWFVGAVIHQLLLKN